MKRHHLVWMPLALLLALGACEDDPAPPKPADKPAATTKPQAAAMTDEELDKSDIPVAEDFEDEAEKEITEDNLDDEVAKLEKEIGGGATDTAAAAGEQPAQAE